MKTALMLTLVRPFLAIQVHGSELEPPVVPQEGELYMPSETENFSEGLWYIIKTAIGNISPELTQAAGVCLGIVGIVLLVALLKDFSKESQRTVVLSAVISVGVLMLSASNSHSLKRLN